MPRGVFVGAICAALLSAGATASAQNVYARYEIMRCRTSGTLLAPRLDELLECDVGRPSPITGQRKGRSTLYDLYAQGWRMVDLVNVVGNEWWAYLERPVDAAVVGGLGQQPPAGAQPSRSAAPGPQSYQQRNVFPKPTKKTVKQIYEIVKPR